MDKELRDYIRKMLAEGYGRDQLQQYLVSGNFCTEVEYDAVLSGPKTSPDEIGYWKRVSRALFHPHDFFQTVIDEEGIWQPLKFFALTMLFSLVLFFVPLFLAIGIAAPLFPEVAVYLAAFTGTYLVGTIAGLFFFTIPVAFLSTLFTHLWMKLIGGKGTFVSTYQATAYSAAPLYFLWVPVLGWIFAPWWQVILLYKGLSELHSVTKMRIFVTSLIALVFFAGLILAAGLLFPQSNSFDVAAFS